MNGGQPDRIDCAVIGGGVIGLAIARTLALAGRDVVILEAEGAIGSGISSRNSEVIHAGIYYPAGSLKARLCVRGNRLLRDYAARRGIDFSMVGKLIVAADQAEVAGLDGLAQKARDNGTEALQPLSAAQAQELEPALRVAAALYSPATGIIDSHGLMLSLLGEAEENGAVIAYHAPVLGGEALGDGMMLEVGGSQPTRLWAATTIIAAGLDACPLARRLGLTAVPDDYLCRGNYFTLTGAMPFRHLVYPLPDQAGLGVHYTVDLAGRGRFGPDVDWVTARDYRVDPGRAPAFAQAIRRYWPGLDPARLEPSYAGIRPKVQTPDGPAADFIIHGPDAHGAPGVLALYGIESPGLTACLALAELVKEKVA